MLAYHVRAAMETVREARAKWLAARRKFDADSDYVMTRLIYEAMANQMSVEQIAEHSGLTVRKVRALIRSLGIDPKRGRRAMAAHAAEALANNAELLGVEPHEIDLMSPLAYLPMGSELKAFLETERNSIGAFEAEMEHGVTPEMVDTFKAAWHKADDRNQEGSRVQAGLIAVMGLINK